MDAALKVSRAVTNLAFNQPFFGSCLMQLRLVEDESIPTMCTDGREVRWGREFVDGLSEDDVRFVLAHEVMHVILKHCQPWKGRDQRTCNMAMDYVINEQLEQSGFRTVEGGLIDRKGRFTGMAWEEVYRILEQIKQDEENGNTDKFSDEEKDDIKQQLADNEASHIEPSDAKTAAEQAEDSDRIDDMVIRAATQQEMSGKGDCPAGMRERIKEIRTAQIPWQEQLQKLVKCKYPEDFSYSRPNRRHIGSGLYLPTMTGEEAGDIVIAVDTSGSVSQAELKAFVGEVNCIINDIKPRKVYLMSSDTAVADVKEYDRDHYFTDFEAVGGGGTSFKPVFEYIEEHKLDVDQLIYFSDMYVWDGDFPAKHPDFPVVWCSSGNDYNVPFGELVKIKA